MIAKQSYYVELSVLEVLVIDVCLLQTVIFILGIHVARQQLLINEGLNAAFEVRDAVHVKL